MAADYTVSNFIDLATTGASEGQTAFVTNLKQRMRLIKLPARNVNNWQIDASIDSDIDTAQLDLDTLEVTMATEQSNIDTLQAAGTVNLTTHTDIYLHLTTIEADTLSLRSLITNQIASLTTCTAYGNGLITFTATNIQAALQCIVDLITHP